MKFNTPVKALMVLVIVALIVVGFIYIPSPTPTPSTTNSVEVGDTQTITWNASDYARSKVIITVIRKIGENPNRYEFVRTVSAATANDGSAVWVPAVTDVGADISVEVGCPLEKQECHATAPISSLAVVDTGRYANTANSYKAIEQSNNK